MYICLCHAVTDRDIRQALEEGARGMRDLRKELKVGSQCGRCTCAARQEIRRFYQISEPGAATISTLVNVAAPASADSDAKTTRRVA
mgnify:CR=1 FL=1